MCGRAGRDGLQTRTHLLLTTDAEKINDLALKSFCTDKENCLQSLMIRSLGGTVEQTSLCCMVCNPSAFSDSSRLSVLQIGKAPPRKKRRVAVRKLNQSTIDEFGVKIKGRANKIHRRASQFGHFRRAASVFRECNR